MLDGNFLRIQVFALKNCIKIWYCNLAKGEKSYHKAFATDIISAGAMLNYIHCWNVSPKLKIWTLLSALTHRPLSWRHIYIMIVSSRWNKDIWLMINWYHIEKDISHIFILIVAIFISVTLEIYVDVVYTKFWFQKKHGCKILMK